jgi:ribose transport system permease protein
MPARKPFKTVDAYALTGQPWRSRVAPSRLLSDLVAKRWMEGAVPVALATLLSIAAVLSTPGFGQSGDWSLIFRETAEKGFLVIGLTVVIIAGGIDLSIGSMTGVVAMTSLAMFRVYQWPTPIIVVVALVLGALMGAINGALVARVKTRPFITTLVTGLTFRALVQFVLNRYSTPLAYPRDEGLWNFIGDGTIGFMKFSVVLFLVLLLVSHIGLTRSRWGWWVTAVGSDRRSARRNSIPTTRVLFFAYVFSGLMCGVGGLAFAARQGSTSDQLASGYEIAALTAVVLGGVSLRGGRGSVVRAAIGILVVAVISQAIIKRNVPDDWNTLVLALALLCFAILDLKWGKYRSRLAEKLALVPGGIEVGELIDVTQPGTKWTINHKMTNAEPIGLGVVQGGEDCALDDQGRLYCGDRRGWIWRFSGENFEHSEIFSRTGGLPLGLAWDLDATLLVAVGGMGLYRIDEKGKTYSLANQTKRSRFRVLDDSAIRFADDLDVAPDGAIYFSDFSTRINAADYHLELVEYRPNGRMMRYDPKDGSCETVVKNYVFPNGVCTAHDGNSMLIASTGLYRIDRLWISGPKQGQMEPVMTNLPGFPDNVNRSSDGNYWMSFVAMRTPVADLFIRHPNVRRRMSKELPVDDWVIPQLNVSCVVKFSDAGEVLDVLWDGTLENHPMVTSMNEFDGHLYLGGLQNNRIGKLKLDPAGIGSIDPRRVPTTTSQVFWGDVALKGKQTDQTIVNLLAESGVR